MMKFSVQAMSGTTSKRSMRLQGQVGKFTAIILIDSGSSSTFISKALADRLEHPISSLPLAKVKVAGGGTIDCVEYLPAVTWFTQGHKFTIDLKVVVGKTIVHAQKKITESSLSCVHLDFHSHLLVATAIFKDSPTQQH
jgi:hypothetical protein